MRPEVKADKKKFVDARRRAYEQLLEPAGFKQGKEMYIRVHDEQVHAIEFQISSPWACEYFINLGFHYKYVSPLSEFQGGEPKELRQIDLGDVLLRCRLDEMMPSGYPRSFYYNVQELDKQVEQNVRDAIDVMDRVGAQWSDPDALLQAMSPSKMEENWRTAIERGPYRPLVGGWGPLNRREVTLCLGLIAIRLGNFEAASAYADVLRQFSTNRLDKQFAMWLDQAISSAKK